MNIVDVKQFTDYDGKRQYVWQTLPILQAMRLAEPRLRCPECYGAVGLFTASADGKMPAHAEHRRKNKNCTLCNRYDGSSKRKHPLAIEPEQRSINASDYGN